MQRAKPAQEALLAIANDNPQRTLTEVMKMRMPVHHDVRAKDVDLKRLGAVLAVSHDRELQDFASLLLLENVGPRTLQSLAMIAEVIHGTPTRFTDPARFSFALGGKDGHPFPVPLKTYDESIEVLRRSLDAAKVGDTEKIDGMKRLEKFVRAVEKQLRARSRLRRGDGARTRDLEVAQWPQRLRAIRLAQRKPPRHRSLD